MILPEQLLLRNVIYRVSCSVNGKLYVGQTRQRFGIRLAEHRNCALGTAEQSYSKRTAIARAMRKYGFDAFDFEIIEICEPDRLDEREAYWIAELGSLAPAGYNLQAGGKNAPRSAEVGQRISAANKGRVKTPEWRAALSRSHMGKVISPEQRAKASAIQKGRKQSAETKRRRSVALLLDLTGRRIGNLVVLHRAEDYINPTTGKGLPRWLCQCDCGNQKAIRSAHLIGGSTQSCGCTRYINTPETRANKRAAALRRYGRIK